jgi:hypothetical protein
LIVIKEGIDRILELSPPNIQQLNNLDYTDKALTLVMSPKPESYDTTTLTGLITLLEAAPFDTAATVLKVDSLASVSLVARTPDNWGRIYTHAVAGLDKELKQFPFDGWIEHEKFVIGLLSQFVRDGDLDALVDLASKITDEASVETTDDGFGQKAVIKAGVALKAEKTIKSRVSLRPYRTFREVEQPASDFIFRIRGGGACALFEADGGAWRVAAMKNLSSWLTNALRGSNDPRLNSLPVVV